MEHRLTDIADVRLRHDNKFAVLTFKTRTAPPFTLEVEVAELDQFIGQLLAIAHAAGIASGADQRLPTTAPVHVLPVQATSMGAMLGPQRQAFLLLRVGTLTMALQVPASMPKTLGHELVALGTLLESEPTTPQ